MPPVRAATPADAATLAALHQRIWGGPIVVGHGVAYDLRTLPALLCADGALAYQIVGDELEVVSIAAATPGHGVGTALLEAAKALTPRRLWLVTTNDNVDALRFYQRRGLRIVAVAPGAVDRGRALKPGIPLQGAYGIDMHDELTLEWHADTV